MFPNFTTYRNKGDYLQQKSVRGISRKFKKSKRLSMIFIFLGSYTALKDSDQYIKILAVSSNKALKFWKRDKNATGMKDKRKGEQIETMRRAYYTI